MIDSLEVLSKIHIRQQLCLGNLRMLYWLKMQMELHIMDHLFRLNAVASMKLTEMDQIEINAHFLKFISSGNNRR